MDFIVLQKITAIVFLLIFFVGRYVWSYTQGKRIKVRASKEIVTGRFLVSLIASLLLPLALILNVFDIATYTYLGFPHSLTYTVGVILAIFGIIFMALARIHRKKDWGLMGDDAGDVIFTQGVYSITRHPYYVGAISLGLGIYLILNSWIILCMIPVIWFMSRVIREEDRFLRDKFKNEWVEYKHRVGVFPFLHRKMR